MARTRKDKLDGDPVDPQLWLAGVLRTRFDKVMDLYSAPLTHPRHEGVHQMRVAIRRLRSALREFAQITNKFPLKKIRKELKFLADLLGAVRDLDVAIRAFTKASRDADDAGIKKGISEIIEDCKNQRHEAFARLRKHLSEDDLAKLKMQFDRAFDKALRQPRMFSARSVEEAARAVIESCLERFLKNVEAIYDPFAVRRIHQLRISGKHLRYSIELFDELWDGRLKPFAEETKKMQSYLGDLHDRDFWIAGSSKRISSDRPRSTDEELVYQARIWLLSEFTRQRMQSYRSALATWSEWRSTDLPGRLRQVIGSG